MKVRRMMMEMTITKINTITIAAAKIRMKIHAVAMKTALNNDKKSLSDDRLFFVK
ncbi:hypothetical protein ACQRC6_03485 [Peptoniphilus sp. SGI.035]|uniref:hypothetical protein n=1 Tax=Peptoniphilus sp. SGI.035 TaxID=3420564 RepID=UPI003CFEAB84